MLKLLVAHREDLAAERTRVENRLRWHLHDLDPERAALLPTRHLEQRRVLDELEAWLSAVPDSVQVGIVRELVGRCRELTLRANQLQAELRHRVMRVCPRLLSLPGFGVLTAVKIVAEVAEVGRFRSEAALAMYAGAAPLECSSGAWQRHRLSRVGNRQLNAALHRIAVTQLRVHPPPRPTWRGSRRRASPSGRRCGSSSGVWSGWSSTCCRPISIRPDSTRLRLRCRRTNRRLDIGRQSRSLMPPTNHYRRPRLPR